MDTPIPDPDPPGRTAGTGGDGALPDAGPGVVSFDPGSFRNHHPEFRDTPDAALHGYFETAELLLSETPARNTPASSLSMALRTTLLHAMVCHLATLARQKSVASGPVTGATMGSISLSFGRPASDADPFLAWLEQTPCGAFAAVILRRLPRPGPRLVRARRR